MNKENSIKCKNNKAIILGGGVQQKQKKKTNYFPVEIQKPKKPVYQFSFTGFLIIYRCVNKQFFVHTPLCTKKKKKVSYATKIAS